MEVLGLSPREPTKNRIPDKFTFNAKLVKFLVCSLAHVRKLDREKIQNLLYASSNLVMGTQTLFELSKSFFLKIVYPNLKWINGIVVKLG